MAVAGEHRTTPGRHDARDPAPPVQRDPRWVRAAHERFLATGELAAGVDPVVAASWRRSLVSGVDPDDPDPLLTLPAADLDAYRAAHPLAGAMPLVRSMLVEAAVDDGLVVAVSDDAGRLMWVEGAGRTRAAVDRVGFVEGAVWREERVGTNAPGTALATRRPVQVIGAEHYSRAVQGLSCAAAPIRDLRDGSLLGVLDVTGGRAAASRVVLSLVRATVAGVERELARRTGHAPGGAGPGASGAVAAGGLGGPGVELAVLGPRPVLRGPGGERPLSLRHAEILVLLAAHPRGLAADELAVLLHPGDLTDVSVRAEVSRLRRVTGPLLAQSRPYRLALSPRTDADDVRAALAAGDVGRALAAYPGPLLPRSVAPGVERLRAELAAELRAAVLASREVGVLQAWVRTDDGADDHEAWARLARLAPPGSPLALRARAHLDVLDRLLR
ncbi:transcriptional regulator [Puerhibacterium sp. TATVAM-FAB25]|uniref:transcriptional regulator n=1 Tax=Puerhibacterium sp. TATVAM-FAB25 TaxID=3093699 RepID=UPI00397990BE